MLSIVETELQSMLWSFELKTFLNLNLKLINLTQSTKLPLDSGMLILSSLVGVNTKGDSSHSISSSDYVLTKGILILAEDIPT
jgi:hypothetical protein